MSQLISIYAIVLSVVVIRASMADFLSRLRLQGFIADPFVPRQPRMQRIYASIRVQRQQRLLVSVPAVVAIQRQVQAPPNGMYVQTWLPARSA